MQLKASSSSSEARLGSLAVMVLSGALLAAVPATAQAVGSRLLDTETQSELAISIGVGSFLAAILNAITLEARLSDVRVSQRSYLPWWSVAIGVVGGALSVGASFGGDLYFIIGLPLLMIALQIGRTHAVTAHRVSSEALTSTVLLALLVVAYVVALQGNRWALGILGIGTLAAVLIRAVGSPLRAVDRVAFQNSAWVGSETAIVAATPLVTNILVLWQMGAAEAVEFRLVLTTIGVIQPILGFLRTRLLSSSSLRVSLVLSLLTGAALVFVLLCDLTGLLSIIFGASWELVSFAVLTLACVWKLVSIFQTFPFARMRRRGEVRLVFSVRAISTVIYIAAAVCSAVISHDLIAVFAAFIAAEVVTALLYFLADRWARRRESLV